MTGTGEPDIRELQALLYPAAANAIRQYGPFWRSSIGRTDLLDWPSVLVVLHHAGLICLGPSSPTVSYWYLTWRFKQSAAEEMCRLLGPSWSIAAFHRMWRSAVGGPRVRNASLKGTLMRPSGGPRQDAQHPKLRFAFRLLDEPAPWMHRRKDGRRLRWNARDVPPLWASIPWAVPTNLQERPGLTDHLAPMGVRDGSAILRLVEDTKNGAMAMAEIDSIKGCIVALEGFRDSFLPGTQEHAKCDDAVSAVRTHLDEILAKRAEHQIAAFNTSQLESHLDVAMSFISQMSDSPRKSQLLGRVAALRPRVPKR